MFSCRSHSKCIKKVVKFSFIPSKIFLMFSLFFGFSLSNELNISYLIATVSKNLYFSYVVQKTIDWLNIFFFKIEHEYFLNVLRRNLTIYVIFQPVFLGGALGKSYKFSSPTFPWRTLLEELKAQILLSNRLQYQLQ